MKKLIFPLLLVSCTNPFEKKKDEPTPPPPATNTSTGTGAASTPTPLPSIPTIPPIPGMPTIPGLPVPPGKSPTPPTTPTNPDQIAKAVIDEINTQRVEAGLAKLDEDTSLDCAAKAHADDAGKTLVCGHTGSDGSSPWDRAKACNNTEANGEVIACGQTSAKDAVAAWMASPGHHAIIMNPSAVAAGAAMFNNYWVVVTE